MRRALLLVILFGGVGLAGAAAFLLQSRISGCAAVPLLAENLLPNPTLLRHIPTDPMPDGWLADAPGAQLRGPAVDGQGFDYDGDGRAIQLIGIANAVQSPPAAIHPGQMYCLAAHTLTDSDKQSSTRLQVSFRWLDAAGQILSEDSSNWQPVVLWQPTAPPHDWTTLSAAFRAPERATQLVVRIVPASDDRVYLDAIRVQIGGQPSVQTIPPSNALVELAPWPNGYHGALSFSFDWETAMGGLIHSRSVDDPYGDQDPIARALRMRTGVTTTLQLFRPYGIRATYFANGYNFLLGNTQQRTFMDNPTFAWASSEAPYAWRTDVWTQRPWFAPDPYGTVASDPAWYFGDLVPLLQAERQAIESHTFSHMYAGFAPPAQLQTDLSAWNASAAERQVAPARAMAFPWSGSAGMADASWSVLETDGISVVTRTNRSQRQYQIVRAADVHCRSVPGHERILACPDFYLTPRSAPQALGLIDRAIAQQGMIDLWAHTEEVTALDQLAAWGLVVKYAARRQSAGELWIAPLTEIADWQQSLAKLRITKGAERNDGATLVVQITNPSAIDLKGLTVQLPFVPGRILIDGASNRSIIRDQRMSFDLPAGATVELAVWAA
jgi:hypothetical protein